MIEHILLIASLLIVLTLGYMLLISSCLFVAYILVRIMELFSTPKREDTRW